MAVKNKIPITNQNKPGLRGKHLHCCTKMGIQQKEPNKRTEQKRTPTTFWPKKNKELKL